MYPPYALRNLEYQIELPPRSPAYDVYALQAWVHEAIEAMGYLPHSPDRPRFCVDLGHQRITFCFSDQTLATAFRIMWA
jgi:hypothetical protein